MQILNDMKFSPRGQKEEEPSDPDMSRKIKSLFNKAKSPRDRKTRYKQKPEAMVFETHSSFISDMTIRDERNPRTHRTNRSFCGVVKRNPPIVPQIFSENCSDRLSITSDDEYFE